MENVYSFDYTSGAPIAILLCQKAFEEGGIFHWCQKVGFSGQNRKKASYFQHLAKGRCLMILDSESGETYRFGGRELLHGMICYFKSTPGVYQTGDIVEDICSVIEANQKAADQIVQYGLFDRIVYEPVGDDGRERGMV